MKRHAALQDLSRDHFHALNCAQAVRRALEGSPRGPAPDQACRDLLAFWDEDARLHFREEEEVLLPIVGRHGPPSQDEAIRRMLDDHAWFRDAFAALHDRFQADGDYKPLLGEIGQRLEDHVRLEERVIFQAVQERLTARDLDDLAARSLAFRTACRSPARIGPVRGGGACALPRAAEPTQEDPA